MPIRLDELGEQKPSRSPLQLESLSVGGESPRATFKRPSGSTKRPVTTEQVKAIEQTDKAIMRLQGLIGEMKKGQFKTGPLSPRFHRGTIGNVAMQYRGTVPEADFKAANERFVNEYITAQTGAQRGFKEMQWLGTAIPNVGEQIPEKFLPIAMKTLEELNANRKQMVEILGAAGYQAEDIQKIAPQSNEDDPYVAEARRRGLIK